MSRFAVAAMVFVAAISTGACARLTGMQEASSPDTSTREMLSKAETQAKSGKYSDALESYKNVIKSHENTPFAAEAQYASIMLYVTADNPHKDYPHALAMLEEFITKNPKHEHVQDARNWRQAIKTLLEFQRENERFSKQIERLKQLDMRQEEKRRGR